MGVFGTNILEGKVAYVAGGTRGFNLAIAKLYSAQGAKVAVMSRDEERCASAAKEINEAGGEAIGLPADARDYDRVAETMKETAETFGGLDIVIAGQAGNFYAPALGMSSSAFQSVVDIDLMGTFNLYRASFEHLRTPGASLIAITAPEAVKPLPFQSHVCASKAAVNMLTKCLAIEWGPAGVRVNGISPGPIEDTWGMDNVIATMPGVKERITASTPLRRWGTAPGHRGRGSLPRLGRVVLRHRHDPGRRRRHHDQLGGLRGARRHRLQGRPTRQGPGQGRSVGMTVTLDADTYRGPHSGQMLLHSLKRHRGASVLQLGDRNITGQEMADEMSRYVRALEDLGAGTGTRRRPAGRQPSGGAVPDRRGPDAGLPAHRAAPARIARRPRVRARRTPAPPRSSSTTCLPFLERAEALKEKVPVAGDRHHDRRPRREGRDVRRPSRWSRRTSRRTTSSASPTPAAPPASPRASSARRRASPR